MEDQPVFRSAFIIAITEETITARAVTALRGGTG